MRKILIICALATAICTSATTPREFITDFGTFVNKVSTDTTMTRADHLRADSTYNVFMKQYDDVYKKDMTQKERDEFFKYKGRYTKYRIANRVNNIGGKVDSVGTNVGDKINQEVSFIQGLFGSDKKSEKK